MEGEEEKPNLVASAKVNVRAPVDLVWALLVDAVDYPQLYDKNVGHAKILTRELDLQIAKRDLHLLAPKLVVRHGLKINPPERFEKPPAEVPKSKATCEKLAKVEAFFLKFDAEKKMITKERIGQEVLLVAGGGEEGGEVDEAAKQAAQESLAEAVELMPRVGSLFQAGWEDTFAQADVDEDGMLSWQEFQDAFFEAEPMTVGSILYALEKLGAVEDEMEPVKSESFLKHELRKADSEDRVELVLSFLATAPGASCSEELKVWLKGLARTFRSLAEKLAVLAPTLSMKEPYYNKQWQHSLVRKATDFRFPTDITIERSPSAMGYECPYSRSPTPACMGSSRGMEDYHPSA